MKEENILRKHTETKSPFKVPDNYFTDFSQQLLDNLQEVDREVESPKYELWQRVRPWLYMAAIFVGAALLIRTLSSQMAKSEEYHLINDEDTQCQYIEQQINGAMISDYDLYTLSVEDNND